MRSPNQHCRHIYSIKSTIHTISQSFRQPSSILPIWSGRVRGLGMTTNNGRHHFPGGSDPCLKGWPVVQPKDCWSLAALPAQGQCCSYPVTDNTGGRRCDQATHHLHLRSLRGADRRVRDITKWNSNRIESGSFTMTSEHYAGLSSPLECLFGHMTDTDAIPCILDPWALSLHSKLSPQHFLWLITSLRK